MESYANCEFFFGRRTGRRGAFSRHCTPSPGIPGGSLGHAPVARLSVPRGISLSQASEKYGHMFRGVLFSLSDSYSPGR